MKASDITKNIKFSVRDCLSCKSCDEKLTDKNYELKISTGKDKNKILYFCDKSCLSYWVNSKPLWM